MDVSVPSPVGGWNARDALDGMQPTEAVRLVNWFPGEGAVASRGGSRESQDHGSNGIETVVGDLTPTTQQLLIAEGTRIRTSPIDPLVTPVDLGTGFTNARWQTTKFNSGSGPIIIWVNGADQPQQWDGTTLTALTMQAHADETEPFDATTLIGVTVFKGRAYYWAEDQGFWYADIGAYQGDMRYFPLGQRFQLGGSVQELLTWTRDGGDGVDDLLCAISTEGETLVLQGSNPNDATDWNEVGRFYLGEPLSVRGSSKLASDRIVITKDGFVNLSTALQQARASEENNISTKIIRAARDYANSFDQNYGWEATLFPPASWFIVNAPVQASVDPTESRSEQFVMNTNTGAWTLFRGWNAVTFAVYDDRLFFGTYDGKVMEANIGTNDAGFNIVLEAIPAFLPMEDRAKRKQLTAASVLTTYQNPSFIDLVGAADFVVPSAGTIPIPPETIPAQWDFSPWEEHYWAFTGGVGTNTTDVWQPCQAHGYMLSMLIRLQTAAQRVAWYSTKYRYRTGGTI